MEITALSPVLTPWVEGTLKTRRIDTLLSKPTPAQPLTRVKEPPQPAATPAPESVSPLKTPAVPETGFLATARDFVKHLWPHAKACAQQLGIDPALLLAQVALETGWGQHLVDNSENYFNLKARTGEPAVETTTTEYIDNRPLSVKASFRQYQNAGESFASFTDLLQQAPRYRALETHTDDPNAWLSALQRAGFATDPHYAEKVMAIYRGNTLQEAIRGQV